MTHHLSFAKACEQWLDIDNIWTPIGWPNHIQNFNVLWNGSIFGMPDLSARSRKWANQGIRVTPIPRWPGWVGYEVGGWLRDDNSVRQGWNPGPAPVLWSEFVNNGLVLRSETFAFLPGGCESETGEEPLFAWMRLSIAEKMEGCVHDRLAGFYVMIEKPAASVGMTRGINVQFDDDTRYPRPLRPSGKSYSKRDGFMLLERGERVRVGVAPGQACRVDHTPPPPRGKAPIWGHRHWHKLLIQMNNRAGASVDLLIPMVPVDRKRFRAVAAEGYESALKQTTAFWRRRLKPPALRVPEEPINACILNSVRFSHMLTERDPGTGDLCKVNGSWAYNSLWATPGSMDLTMMMDTLGYHDFVESYLDIFCKEQGRSTPPGLQHHWGKCDGSEKDQKGAFARHPGYFSPPDRYKAIDWLTDNGAILYVMSMHGLLSGNKRFIQQRLPNIVRSCEWIRDARAIKDHGGCPGILPPAVNSDLCDVIQGVWGIGWNYLGLRKAVKLLKRVGHPRASEFAREMRDYRDTFLAAYRHSVEQLPTWTDARGRQRCRAPSALLKGAMPSVMGHAFALDSGPLFLVFAGLMRATDPVMRDVLAWFREGPPAQHMRRESDCWQMSALDREMSSCEPCYSWNLFHSLHAGDHQQFLQGLYSLYAGGMSRKTWISCETRGGITGNVFTAPLPIYLSRLALLDDTWKEDELHILRMVPPEWLKAPGLKLDRIPTEHGPVSMEASLSKDGKRLSIRYEAKYHAPPKRVVLHVPRLPGLRETRLNGKRIKAPRVLVHGTG